MTDGKSGLQLPLTHADHSPSEIRTAMSKYDIPSAFIKKREFQA
jgi:hypothetical protein